MLDDKIINMEIVCFSICICNCPVTDVQPGTSGTTSRQRLRVCLCKTKQTIKKQNVIGQRTLCNWIFMPLVSSESGGEVGLEKELGEWGGSNWLC